MPVLQLIFDLLLNYFRTCSEKRSVIYWGHSMIPIVLIVIQGYCSQKDLTEFPLRKLKRLGRYGKRYSLCGWLCTQRVSWSSLFHPHNPQMGVKIINITTSKEPEATQRASITRTMSRSSWNPGFTAQAISHSSPGISMETKKMGLLSLWCLTQFNSARTCRTLDI